MSPDADSTPDGIHRPDTLPDTLPDEAVPPRRVSRWDRPKHPKDWRYWVGGFGRALMVLGILMFGFVAYQLWGTAIEYRQHQDDLEREFESRIAELATSIAPTTLPSATPPATTLPSTPLPSTTLGPPTTGGATPSTVASTSTSAPPAVSPWPAIELGDVIAWIDIPRLGKTVYAVAGIRTQDLKQGLGHYPDTPLPGQLGNVAFAGHRTTYGAPLYSIDELAVGDVIEINTLTGVKYVYRVTGPPEIVAPSAYHVITNSDPTKATLTITSCHPRYSARQRIVVRAELDTSAAPPSGAATHYVDLRDPVIRGGDDPPDDSVVVPGDGPDAATDDESVPYYDGAEGLSRGWFSDSGAWPHVLGWAVVISAVCAAAYLLNRRLRRHWPGIVLAIVPVLITLYFLYQNVNRLLPPDL